MLLRDRRPELMDDPSLDYVEHMHALKGLAILNSASGAARYIWQALKQLIDSRHLSRIRVLDIATGGADVALSLWQIAKRRGYDLRIDGCDASDAALKYSRSRAVGLGAPSEFFLVDVLEDTLPAGYDVVMTSLFTHHLDDKDTVRLLTAMKGAANHMVLVNDLERSRVNMAMVWIACHLFSTSYVVRYDGPTSVQAAYTRTELEQLARDAGMSQVSIARQFPCRMMLTWRKEHE